MLIILSEENRLLNILSHTDTHTHDGAHREDGATDELGCGIVHFWEIKAFLPLSFSVPYKSPTKQREYSQYCVNYKYL